MENSYALNSPEGSGEAVWRAGGSPTGVGHRGLDLGHVPGAGSGPDSPLCGTEAAMSTLAFPPLEFESLPGALSLSCPPSYRDYPLFKAEKSPHDIADALLSLKHAVVHPQFAGPLSPLSPPPMPHLGHVHCPPGQGLSPYPSLPSPGPQGASAAYGSAHGQSMLHNAYSVGVEVGVGSQLPHQYGHQYPEPCPSPPGQVPTAHPPPPPHHPAQASMTFPAMSVNVSMSMNVGMPPNLGGAAYNCGPPHPQQWPPPPHQAQPPSPAPLGSQYHQPPGNLHSTNWLQSAAGQYPGYPATQLSGGQPHHHHVVPSYTSSASYTFGSDFRSPVTGEARGFYYHKPPGGVDSFKDAARYCPMRHPHHHLHHGHHNHGAHAAGLSKRSKFLSDKMAMAAAAAAVSVSGGGTAGMMMGVGVGVGVGDSVAAGGVHSHGGHHQGLLKTNLCRICGKTYARPSTLKTHLRTHSGEKPYKCSTCSKSFSQAANLTAHIRTHSGEKPFRCPVCDRRFSQSSSVTTHMRTHSGDRPYRCRLCKKAFSDSSTLTKHLRIHSGEKPYQCKLCLLRFSQSGNLNRHMRVHANQT